MRRGDVPMHDHVSTQCFFFILGEAGSVFQVVESLLKTKWTDDLYPRAPRSRS